MSFWSWLTGRSEKESDVYANYDKVDTVVNDIQGIARRTGDAQVEIIAAIQQLNNVNGLAEYVGTVEVGGYDSVFKSIQDSIVSIGDQLQGKAENIKAYEESPWYKKAASTFTMALTKAGEGLLSVVEDIGDGVVSLVGWGAGVFGADQFQSDCANFVKKEWSHDAFNFYYQSDFAKASAITEDSAAAGAFKLAGKCVGYLYAGGAIAGAMGALGVGGATGVVGSGILSASTTTLGATAAGFLGGLGSGTESGLNLGLEYNDAMKVGLKEGAIQGGLAFAGGKLSEISQANTALKASGEKGGIIKAAQKVGTGGQYNVQGYTDAVTKAGQRFGEAAVNTTKAGITALKETASASVAIRKGAIDAGIKTQAAETAKATFKDNLKVLAKENPLAQGVGAVKTGATALSSGVKSAATTLKEKGLGGVIKDGATAAKNGIVTGAQTVKSNGLLKSAISGVGKITTTAGKIITNPTVLSVGATTAGVALNESISKASQEVLKNSVHTEGIKQSLEDAQGTRGFTLTTTTPTPKTGDEMFVQEEVTDADHDYGNNNNTIGSTQGGQQTSTTGSSGGVQPLSSEEVLASGGGNNVQAPDYTNTNTGGNGTSTGGNGVNPINNDPINTGGNSVKAPDYTNTNTNTGGNGTTTGGNTLNPINIDPINTGGNNVKAPDYTNTNTGGNGTTTGGNTLNPINIDPINTGGNNVKAPDYTNTNTGGNGTSTGGSRVNPINIDPLDTGGKTVKAPDYTNTNTGGNGTSTGGSRVNPINIDPLDTGGKTVKAPEYTNQNGGTGGKGTTSGTSTGGKIAQLPDYSGGLNNTTSGGDNHSGGGYSSTSGYTGTSIDGAVTGTSSGGLATSGLKGAENLDSLDEVVKKKKNASSLDGIIKGSKLTKLPTSKKPINQSASSSKSAVIPIAAGLSAAAAAGIGAKAYVDHKKDEEYEDEYEEDDEFDTSDWTENDNVEEYVEKEPEIEGFADNLAADIDEPYDGDETSMEEEDSEKNLDDFVYSNDLLEA